MRLRCGLIVAAAALAFGPVVAAVDVPQWSVHEITLTSARDFANPYADVEVVAEFTGPDGTVKRVRGFSDGGRTFKVRFAPTARGAWTFAITSSPSDAGLTQRGEFSATAPRSGSHGFLRRDPQYPTSFSFDDGTRFYMLGTTYYGIIANARSGGGWREAIRNTARYGMNKVRLFLLFSRGADKPRARDGEAEENEKNYHFPFSSGFADLAGERLEPAHWRAADDVVRFMAGHGVLADLIVFPYRRAGAHIGTVEQDRRYLRYALARYAAFPNVTWCLVNEWNYSVQPIDYWNELGALARAEDPWGSERGSLRVLSIHQQTRPDWNFTGQTWMTHAILQLGVRNRGKTERVGDEWKPAADGTTVFRNGDEWGNYSIVRNWTGAYPVVNDEYGYIGEPFDDTAGAKKKAKKIVRYTREKHRQTLWGIAVAGGYSAAGDKNDYADGRPYNSAQWHDVPEYGDIQRLIQFFTAPGLAYWRMAPHNELVAFGARVYALAEPGRDHVIYAAAGGDFSVKLAPGKYSVVRFDPRTAARATLPAVPGGAVRLSCPDGQDWVFRVRAEP